MAAHMNPLLNQISKQHTANSAPPINGRHTRPDPTQNTNQASSATGSANNDSAAISANDFLTLLVTEMKNQDPTANTDPNQYINQLVQVNSLEQLISINQTLSADSPTKTTGGIVGRSGFQHPLASTASTPIENGNLTVPESNPAAHRVAQALHTHRSGL